MAAQDNLDLPQAYAAYLARFAESHGEVELGRFVKHDSRLVKKLRFDEFEPLYREYDEVARTYFDAVDRGDTVNDVAVKVLRERASDLVLICPV